MTLSKRYFIEFNDIKSLRVTMAIYNMKIEINRKSFIEHYLFLRCAFFFFFSFLYFIIITLLLHFFQAVYDYYYYIRYRYGLVVHYKPNKSHHYTYIIYYINEDKKTWRFKKKKSVQLNVCVDWNADIFWEI